MAPSILVALALGCGPDLSYWRVVQEGEDAGPPPGQDGGTGTIDPPDLGAPCPNPHVTAVTIAGSSGTARVIRLDPQTGARCRDADLIAVREDFGYAIYDVDWGAGTGTVLGIRDAVLGLGEDGFPAWRAAPPESGFDGRWVVSLGGSQNRVAAAWSERSSSNLEYLRLFDSGGHSLGEPIELPFFSAMVSAHPDGSGRLVWASRRGEIRAVVVSEGIGDIGDEDGEELFAGSADIADDTALGSRQHLDSDVTTGRMAMTHDAGVAIWAAGGPAPTTAISCPSLCDGYHVAAPDPVSATGAFVICTRDGDRHLVHAASSGCERWIDGTSLGSRSLQDVTVVHAAL
ncbi:MAG TPA: hypothetical protein RMH99_06440 [Sandaracinaceae bacterium LLY-WYZ-13_1]|nr:hypothetical protein [Sandaracinaceae bacterium LLY-WYZ-13_1]